VTGTFDSVVEEQLLSCLKDVHIDGAMRLILSYESFWAICTDLKYTRDAYVLFVNYFKENRSKLYTIINCDIIWLLEKSRNTKDLQLQKDTNDLLIGGSFLKPSSICEMLSVADKLLS